MRLRRGMTAMSTKTDQRPLYQEDRDGEPGRSTRGSHVEPRSFVSATRESARNDDSVPSTDLDPADDPEINTHGSER